MNQKEKYEKLRNKIQRNGLYGANLKNTSLTLWMLDDLSLGQNIGGRDKGGRSYGRLITVIRRMSSVCYLIQKKYGKQKAITELTETQVLELFRELREGSLVMKSGKQLKDIRSIGETVVQFWNWWIRVNERNGKHIPNIMRDLNTKNDYKAGWVYLTKQEIKEIGEHCNPYYKTLLWFMLDAGVRPQELRALRVSDITTDLKGVTWLEVRHEVAKKNSFGRKFKLLISDQLVKDHIQREKLSQTDLLFPKRVEAVKKYYKLRMSRLYGDKTSPARKQYRSLSLYDLRHNSICYWRQRVKDVNALMYRYGHKNPARVFYYDEFIGYKDTIEAEDILSRDEATQLEQELSQERTQRRILEERMLNLQAELVEIQEHLQIQELAKKCGLNLTNSIDADAENIPKRLRFYRTNRETTTFPEKKPDIAEALESQ